MQFALQQIEEEWIYQHPVHLPIKLPRLELSRHLKLDQVQILQWGARERQKDRRLQLALPYV
jgi:hypothetical protein